MELDATGGSKIACCYAEDKTFSVPLLLYGTTVSIFCP